MIESTSPVVEVSGNMHGEVVAMDFDIHSLPKLQSILINMYGDPELAVIREIATNGRDATIEAGSTRPIEVQTPTVLTPFLTVRDYGCGLDVEAIRNVFSKYGASTKTNTNAQTGCLGIGSKSPLAYAPQFTVSSVKNGMRIEVVVSLDNEGAGEMKIVEPGAPTDEPNGTEIIVAAKRHNAIAAKARNLFSFWPEGTVLLDGEPVGTVEGEILSDKPATVRVETPDGGQRDVRIERMVVRQEGGDSIIVMGGVPYPIPTEHNDIGLSYSQSVVAWVAMGEVHFAPNRERLRETPATMQVIKAVHDHFDYSAAKAIQNAINGATTAGEALRTMIRWTSWLPERLKKEAYSFKGKDLPARFEMPGDEKMTVISQRPHKLSAHQRYGALAADTAVDAVWLYGYDRPSFTAGQRKKIDMWAESMWPGFPYGTDQPEHFILVEKMPQSDYIENSRAFDWEKLVKPLRIPRTSSGGGGYNAGRLAGSYDCWIGGDMRYEIPAEDFDQEEPIYYFTKVDSWTEKSDARIYVNMMKTFEPACTVVWLTQNRVNKFKRNFPDAISVQQACRNVEAEWKETLDEPTRELLAFSDKVDQGKFLALAPYAPFACPAINETIARVKEIQANDKLKAIIEERNSLLNQHNFPTTWQDPATEARFPLAITRYDSLHGKAKHAALYINAVVKAEILQAEVDSVTASV